MHPKRKIVFAWVLFAITLLILLIRVAIWVIQLATTSNLPVVDQDVGITSMAGVFFSILGMLIITRLPDNRVGWLMLIIALGAVNPSTVIIASLPTPPTSLSPGLWLILWLNNWVWISVIIPILLIPLHFPTGRPPSRRWNWVNWLAIGLGLFFMLLTAFLTPIGPLDNKEWMLPNPIGFIPDDVANPVTTVLFLGLATMAIASVISLIVRYRRAQEIERHQIKWLLYVTALFAVTYSVTGMNSDSSSPLIRTVNVLGTPLLLAIPIAIAIAILRYRLYDIDILIRRTLQYALLTGLLALVYFGSVVLLQSIFRALTGESSQAAVVISTLGIAALFNPLRHRIQDIIDSRFYRQKYNAEQIMAEFAATARNETDLEALTTQVVNIVQNTMQPESQSLWLKEGTKKNIPDQLSLWL
jgi:hypothetical protein